MTNKEKRSKDKKKAAIVFLNWNNLQFVDKCLDSLIFQTHKYFDLIFVDNDSPEHENEYIKENYVKKIESSEQINGKPARNCFFTSSSKNLGYAGGNTLGACYALKKGGYDLVAFLNPDTTVDKNFLKELINTLFSEEKMAIVSSKIFLYEKFNIYQNVSGKELILDKLDVSYKVLKYAADFKSPQVVTEKKIILEPTDLIAISVKDSEANSDYLKKFNFKKVLSNTNIVQSFGSQFNNRMLSYEDKEFLLPEKIAKSSENIEAICGCALAIKTKYLKKLGVFDPDFNLYAEDIDISLRYIKNGYKIKLAENSLVYHYFWGSSGAKSDEESIKKGIETREFFGTRNRLIILKKYKGIRTYLYSLLRTKFRILKELITCAFAKKKEDYIFLKNKARIRALIASLFYKTKKYEYSN